MPTRDRRLALTADTTWEVVADAVAPPWGRGEGIGLEVELFPIEVAGGTRRMLLDEPEDGSASVGSVLGRHLDWASEPLQLASGSALSTEPGGQVEIATTCSQSVDGVIEEADAATAMLAEWFGEDGVTLAAAGMDLWHDLDAAPQQLRDPRYPAMAGYLAARGPAGSLMMRHTCALQINLDLGSGDRERCERWEVANLLAPVATATFANSPSVDGSVRSRRSAVWQLLDGTRTGFPKLFLEGRGSLEKQLTAAALSADVLLVRVATEPRTGALLRAEPGSPGWSFADWMRHGHPRHGWPTAEDLRYHLTTLFHEVRPRGPVELRSIDALPRVWRAVPVVLYAGAMLDATARERILAVMQRHRPELPSLLRRAAEAGVSDPALCAIAVEVWSFALAGAGRLAGVDRAHLATADRFLDRYTTRGRSPADELAERFRRDPADALRWVGEPVPAASTTRP